MFKANLYNFLKCYWILYLVTLMICRFSWYEKYGNILGKNAMFDLLWAASPLLFINLIWSTEQYNSDSTLAKVALLFEKINQRRFMIIWEKLGHKNVALGEAFFLDLSFLLKSSLKCGNFLFFIIFLLRENLFQHFFGFS